MFLFHLVNRFFIPSLLLLVGLGFGLAQEDNKADWISVGTLQGKLLATPKNNKIRISLEQQFGEIDRDVNQRAETMRKKLGLDRQKALGLPKNSPQREKAMQEIEQGIIDLQNLRDQIIVIHKPGDVLELPLRKSCIVRSLLPDGGVFDEKGNIRNYTLKQLREMRGSSKLPGFASDLEKLTEGQVLALSVYKKKLKAKIAENKPNPEEFDLFAGLIIILNVE